jgi:hypothetical protein
MDFADGALVAAVIIQQGRRFIVFRQKDRVFRLDLGASVFDFLNAFRRETGDQFAGFFTCQFQLFPGDLPD